MRARYLGEGVAEDAVQDERDAVNGQPGLVAQLDGVTGAVYAFEVADDKITNMPGTGAMHIRAHLDRAGQAAAGSCGRSLRREPDGLRYS